MGVFPRSLCRGEIEERAETFLYFTAHVLPGYFLAHAHIDNYHISLGSWYSKAAQLRYNPTTTSPQPRGSLVRPLRRLPATANRQRPRLLPTLPHRRKRRLPLRLRSRRPPLPHRHSHRPRLRHRSLRPRRGRRRSEGAPGDVIGRPQAGETTRMNSKDVVCVSPTGCRAMPASDPPRDPANTWSESR